MMGCLSLFRKQNLKWLGVLATIIMTFVQLGGALVTKTGSEDGCGSSWPLCNGALLPENLPIQTIIELSHRAVISHFTYSCIMACNYSLEKHWIY